MRTMTFVLISQYAEPTEKKNVKLNRTLDYIFTFLKLKVIFNLNYDYSI